MLSGEDGNDTLYGHGGDNVLIGGAGDDVYDVTSSADVVWEAADEGLDTVMSSVNYALGAHLENLLLSGTADRNSTGNDLANAISGNSGNNRIDGAGGKDQLHGWGGDDIIIGGVGNDTLFGGSGADTFLFAPDSGIDLIADFDASEGDRIDITAFTSGVVIPSIVFQSGNDVHINLGNLNIVVIQNASLNDPALLGQIVL